MPPLSLSGVAVPVREARDADRQAVRRVLLAAYSEFAPALGLHTGAFMPAAVALYEAMGFRRAPAPVRVIAYRLDLT
jgi:hypothetical protein